jgi:hypothetical protein
MSKYRFTTIVIGSDIDAALTAATERARWTPPGDKAMTPDRMAIATKTERVVVDRPPRIPAQRIAEWVQGTVEPPKQYEQLVLDLRLQMEDPRGPAIIVPMSYRETTDVLGQMRLDIGHGYHRPFAAIVMGTAPLPSNGQGGVKAKKIARRAKAELSSRKAIKKTAPRPRRARAA